MASSSSEAQPVVNWFERFEGKSGVYFISYQFDEDNEFFPTFENPGERIYVKVGMSEAKTTDSRGLPRQPSQYTGGLASRLDSYLLCYPEGFSVFVVYQTKRDDARWFEQTIQQYLTRKGFKADFEHSHIEEWYFMTPYEILATISYFTNHFASTITNQVFEYPPKFVDTTGRVSNRQRRPMSTPQKNALEQGSQKAPDTYKRPRPNPMFNGEAIPLELSDDDSDET
jgi:hypothetical protein